MRCLLLAALLLGVTPVRAADRQFSVNDFDKVQVDGPFQVRLTAASSSSAKASGSTAALDRLTIDVQGRTLRVRANSSAWGGYPGASTELPVVTLTTRELQGAAVNGSGSLVIDKAKGLKFALSVVGSGRASVDTLDSDTLTIMMMGSGSISIGGKTKTMRAEMHGAASLDASRLTVDDAVIVSDSAGSAKAVARRAATIQANGAGDVEVGGTPACTIRHNGAGQVRCGGR